MELQFRLLWGCVSKSNLAIIQRYQSKILRNITNAPWYVSNHTLHSDLRIPHVRTVFQDRIATHLLTLASHSNPFIEPLLHPLKIGAYVDGGHLTRYTTEASLDAS
jgi:hypothetical protein